MGIRTIDFVAVSATVSEFMVHQELTPGVRSPARLPIAAFNTLVNVGLDARLAALGSDGTEANPVIARGGSGISFDTATRKLNIVTGVKGDPTYPPLIGFILQRFADGVRFGSAKNYSSGLSAFTITGDAAQPKLLANSYILSEADDAIDRAMRRYNGTLALPRGLDVTDIGHVSDRDYTQFAPIWSDGQGTSSPAPWFPPEFQLARPIPATGSIASGGNFTVRYDQHKSGLGTGPVDGHPYFIRIMDMAQGSIPASGGFNFNGSNKPYKRNSGADFAAGTVPKEGLWRYHAGSGTFRADVDSGTDTNALNLFYRAADGSAVLPFFCRSWDRTTWIPSAPTGVNREGLVTWGVTPRNQQVPRVSFSIAGKGLLVPGGAFYHDKLSDDGFFAPDIYPRDGSVGAAGPFRGAGTGNPIIDPNTPDNTDAVSPGVAVGVNHLRMRPMGALSILASHHTRFPTLTLREGPAPDKGIDFAHDTATHELIIKSVDRGSTVTIEAAVFDENGNVNLKATGSALEDQVIGYIESSPVSDLNGFWSLSPTSPNEFSLFGSKLTSGQLATLQAALPGAMTIRFKSTTELLRIGYSGTLKNNVSFKQDVELVSTDAGAAIGPTLILNRDSASPATSDQLGAITAKGRNSAAAVETYARQEAVIVDAAAGSEDAKWSWETVIAGAFATRASIGAGLFHPSATGGDKGNNTINFGAVYDDNALLTDYVFDKLGGIEAIYSERVQQKADEFDVAMFSLENYSAFWRKNGRLYGMPDLNDCIDGIVKEHSLGAMVQKLMQTAELHAIHIAGLSEELKAKH